MRGKKYIFFGYFFLFSNQSYFQNLGKLDCLRVALSPNESEETPEKRDKRKAAQWDGDCSFEAEGNGIKIKI